MAAREQRTNVAELVRNGKAGRSTKKRDSRQKGKMSI
jgi:hypothetical protein